MALAILIAAASAGTPTSATPGEDVNVSGITGDEVENFVTIAASPVDPNRLVVVSRKGPLKACFFYTSVDGGVTWSVGEPLPRARKVEQCKTPMVRASPDGGHFYIAYSSADDGLDVNDIFVYRLASDFSSGHLVVAIPRSATNGNGFDKPWIGVPGSFGTKRRAAAHVYLTVTERTPALGCDILFTRSTDRGLTWSTPTPLAESNNKCDLFFDPGTAPAFDGARPVGGDRGNVLACWWEGVDGWGPDGSGVTFNIDCRASRNFGRSFGDRFLAVPNEVTQLTERLCPQIQGLHEFWTAMLPVLTIAPNGSAHLVYTHDPTPNRDDTECGDIRYVRSPGPPYSEWSTPVTVSDDSSLFPTPQYYPTIVATGNATSCDLHLAYLSQETSPIIHQFYEVFARKSPDCGTTWLPAQRLSDESSFAATSNPSGLALDAAIGPSGASALIVWADRRGEGNQGLTIVNDVFVDRT